MAEAAQAPQQQFAIQRIYLKDVSFEAPSSPVMFQKEWNPDVKLDLDTQSRELGQGVYEVVLRLTVTVKTQKRPHSCVKYNKRVSSVQSRWKQANWPIAWCFLPEHPVPIRT